MKKSLIRKLILFITGYSLYIAIEVTFRGYSFPLMGLCGGLLFIGIDCINEVLPWETDLLLQGCIGSAMITLCELIVGEINKVHGIVMWDYSNMPLNFDGVICVPFSLLWIGLSIVAVIVADCINYYAFKIEPKPSYWLFGKRII
jgi:uncharacterized membrane protein